MDTIEALINRRSVRGFNDKPVPREILDKILLAGMYAPTGRGRQSPIMVVLTKEEEIREFSRKNAEIMGSSSDPFYGAKTIIIVLASRQFPTYLYDGALVMGNLMNSAYSLGVDSCWIHRAKEDFDSDWGKAWLDKWGISGDFEGIGHVALGYRLNEAPSPLPRKENYVYFS